MHRRRARELVLFGLYQSEFHPVAAADVVAEEDPGDQRDYIVRVLEGVKEHQEDIDRRIGEKTVGWRFERLALLDRNILRMGVYELLYQNDVPPEVALDEAVELAKKYGTDPAQSFINGILDRIWKEERERPAS